MNFTALTRALDARAKAGNPARFWLRDDDAVAPTGALDGLLGMTGAHGVPLALAVIPEFSGVQLATRLAHEAGVSVAVHGWSHKNHAPDGEKKQELGAHRPTAVVLDELVRGLRHLAGLHGPRCVPLLVPPWNRTCDAVMAGLPGIGFRAVSVFGPVRAAPLAVINSNVDLIDWRGTRGGRPDAALLAEIVAIVKGGDVPVGLLTHHLVHDTAAWGFLERLFAVTAGHPGCRWLPVSAFMPATG